MKILLTAGMLALGCMLSQNVIAADAPASAPQAGLGFYEGKLVNAEKAPVSLNGKKVVVFYYSAHWCGPCRMVTPKLVEFYNAMSPELKKNVEFVFISSDQDEAKMFGYMNEAKMPWAALKYSERAGSPVKNQSPGIPAMVIVKADGSEVAKGHPMQLLPNLTKVLTDASK